MGWWWTQGNDTREALGGLWSFEVGVPARCAHNTHNVTLKTHPTMHDSNNRQHKGTHCKCHPYPHHTNATAHWGMVLPPHCEVIAGGMEHAKEAREEGIEISRRHQMHAHHTYKQLLIGWFTGCRGNSLDDMANMAPTTTTSTMGEGTGGHVHPHKCQLHLPYHTVSLVKVGGSFIFLSTCCNHRQGWLLFSTYVCCFNWIFFLAKSYSTVINTNITTYNVSCKLV